MSQESGPHTHSPSPILKAAGAKFHAARNFSAFLIKTHWRHPVGVCLWGCCLKQGTVPHIYLDGMTRMARLLLPMLLREEQHCGPPWLLPGTQPFLTGAAKMKSTPVVMKLHSKALPCAFWAQSYVGLSFPRRRRQVLEQGSLLPSGCGNYQALLKLRSAALVP